MSLEMVRYVAIDYDMNVLLMQKLNDDDINSYRQVWTVNKLTPELQETSLLKAFMGITYHTGFSEDSLRMFADLCDFANRIPQEHFIAQAFKNNTTIYRVGDAWQADRDFTEYRTLGTGNSPIDAMIKMKRIGS